MSVFVFTACAGTTASSAAPVAEPQAPLTHVAALQLFLASCASTAEMHTLLTEQLEARDLDRVGFDGVTVTACIDDVIACETARREGPEDSRVAARLAEAIDLYVAVRQGAIVHRTAGTASCLPNVR